MFWMMVLIITMTLNGQPQQVLQVTLKNFASLPDCVAKMETMVLSQMGTGQHNVSVVCQSQPR